jgi:7,8-dihydropterin-6-yl-methyl-4-(beta-D-ribofuranosyl)aminobenzene 5'-phosphate synthase
MLRAADDSQYLGSHGRRRLLRAGTGSIAVAAAGGLFGHRVAVAEPLGSKVPEVDKLAVRVVTDSYHHAFERSAKIGALEVVRFGFAVSPTEPPKRALQNEWGLAWHIESQRGAETRQVLFDFGYTPETLLNNLALLGVDPSKLDAIALSHGHFDHFGGMVGFLEATKGKLRTNLPFYLGGEECFCTRELNVPGNPGKFGALDREAIKQAGLVVTFAEKPSLLASHGFTTGFIPAENFEKVLSPTKMSVGLQGGLGCEPEKVNPAKRTLVSVPDDFEHEHSTVYNVKGRGLVIMTSCGHRGVVNSVRTAVKVSGIDKVHAVLGGFHLAPHPTEYLQQTIDGLKAFNPDFVIPMHCSGEAFISLAQAQFGPKFVRSSTGTRFVFSA